MHHAGVFLIQTLFGLYILAVMLRVLLQWLRAEFYNPLVQALVKITNPPLTPLRRVIPGLYGIDLAAMLLMLVLQVTEIYLLGSLLNISLGPATLVLGAIAKLIDLLVLVFIWSIVIQAILSWVNPSHNHPAVSVLDTLTTPILRPIRKNLPAAGGIDFSPIIAIIALYLIRLLAIAPLRDMSGLPGGF